MRHDGHDERLVRVGNRTSNTNTRIELQSHEQQRQGNKCPEREASEHEMQESKTDGRERYARRLLNLETQALALAIHVHRDPCVFPASQEVLINVAVYLIVACELSQARISAVHPLAPAQLILHLPLQLGETCGQGVDDPLILRLLAAQLLIDGVVDHRLVRLS